MLLAASAVANPQLDPANPTNFLSNVAMAMFQRMDLHDFNGNLVTITNIPIYEDPALFGGTNINYYTHSTLAFGITTSASRIPESSNPTTGIFRQENH